ncbi:MAG: hypothetical protein J0M02_02255 [Planctomycetes bacterium]|nr:hypothetical protein [Planctomycetota bacterium]
MIAPRYPLCDLLRREHRLVRLALMACYVGDDTTSTPGADAEDVRTYIIYHLRFEDRIVIPAIRNWLPRQWLTGDARSVDDWCRAKARRDGQSVRRALAAISRRIVDEERLLLPLIEQHVTVDEQHGLIEQSLADFPRTLGSVGA